jgi:GH25 family lysozyme M1 (1,4-beta-N-acetylmuramidase)/uncharacterized protein YjdB
MKKLFNRIRDNEDNWEDYDEVSTDWDRESTEDAEYYEESEEYAAEDGEYYEETDEDNEFYIEAEEYPEGDEEAYIEAEEYPEGDEEAYIEAEEYPEEDEEAYIEAEEYPEEDGETYIEAEEYPEEDEEVYIEAEEYPEEDEEAYIEAEEYPEEDVEYYEYAEEDDEAYAETEEYPGEDDEFYEDAEDSKRGLLAWFLRMSVMDKVMLGAGAGVLILAIITVVALWSFRNTTGQYAELAAVGAELDGIEVVGDEGLLAVADATMAKLEASKLLGQEESKEYDEAAYNKEVTVTLKTVSVQKDLKIKFVNKSTDKLISNVPFTVTVDTADGKTETWSDDDMDGIIYKKGITPGSYKVTVNPLSDDKYAGYTLPTDTQKVEVKKDIAYQKIDVSDEVKTESEINVATEEQKKQEQTVESSLTDTVEWVESTTVTSTYIEVAKSAITDPLTLVKSGTFLRMAKEVKISPSSAALKVGGNNLTLQASYSMDNVVSVGWSSSDSSVADVDVDGVVTPVSAGTATIICTVTVSEETSEGTEEMEYEGTCEVTVTDETLESGTGSDNPSSGNISLDKTALTVYIGASSTVKATLKNSSTSSVTAKSSDTKVATVAADGKTVTITGVKTGTATVTVLYTEGGDTYSATCAVTVKKNPAQDSTTLLKDNSGNQLYVQENGSYREAVYADYYVDGTKFFKKGETKYTGWQTLDGKVYFFDASGKKVTGEQVIQGAKYTFASDGSLVTGSGTMGIDVSKHNGTIDWSAVKNSGVSYVIIRCGYRGYTQGSLVIDPKFETNIKGATAAGLKVGVYFFSQAVDEVEAVQEASFVLDAVKGYKISYPIFLDVEYSGASGNSGRADGLDKATRTAVCKAFCATIRSGGYTAGIYANKSWLETKLDPGQLSAYKIWLAQYAATPTYTGRYDLWQYKSTGRVSGISGNVDMNLSYLGY